MANKRAGTVHQKWDVYLNGKKIDSVFYSRGAKVDADEVRRSLVNHDGYSSAIVVRRGRL